MKKDHTDMSLEELHKEYDLWNKLANSGNNCNVTGFAHQMRDAAAKWMKVKENETRRLCTESQGSPSS